MTPNEEIGAAITVLGVVILAAVVLWDKKQGGAIAMSEGFGPEIYVAWAIVGVILVAVGWWAVHWFAGQFVPRDRYEADTDTLRVNCEYAEALRDRAILERDTGADLNRAEVEALRGHLAAAAERFDEMTREAQDLRDRLQQAESRIAAAEANEAHYRAGGDRVKVELGRLEVEIERLRKELDHEKSERDRLSVDFDRMRDDRNALFEDNCTIVAERDELRAELAEWVAKGRTWAHLSRAARDSMERMRASVDGMLPDEHLSALAPQCPVPVPVGDGAKD